MAQETDHAGFFAIPRDHIEEINTFDERWRHSYRNYLEALDTLDERRPVDDSSVLRNEMYRRAAAVALHHAEVSGRKATSWVVEIIWFTRRKLRTQKNQAVFFPLEVQDLADRLGQVERRMGGEDAIVARIQRRDPRDHASEIIRELYRAFRQTLLHAAEHGAGFVWASYYGMAEARLAERRREEAEREERRKRAEREARARGPSTDPDPSYAELQARFLAETAVLRRKWFDPLAGEPNPRRRTTPFFFGAIPREHILSIRRALLAAKRRRDVELDGNIEPGVEDSFARIARVEKQANELASTVVALDRHGEMWARPAIFRCLMDVSPGLVQRCGAYAPAQTRRLLSAVERWEADLGMGKLLDQILADIPGKKSRSLAASTYRKLKKVLIIAVEQGHGFYMWD